MNGNYVLLIRYCITAWRAFFHFFGFFDLVSQRFIGVRWGRIAISSWKNWVSGTSFNDEFSFIYLLSILSLFVWIFVLLLSWWPFFSECHWIECFIYLLYIFSQDVNDVLAALDHIIDQGLANPAKVAVLGGSHGGFLTTHLIGQVLYLTPLL